jgi:hypothetical protein
MDGRKEGDVVKWKSGYGKERGIESRKVGTKRGKGTNRRGR